MSKVIEWGKLSERERDGVVAEMMGWTNIKLDPTKRVCTVGMDFNGWFCTGPAMGTEPGDTESDPSSPLHHYTTDIAAAWEVVETAFWWSVSKRHKMYGEGHDAIIRFGIPGEILEGHSWGANYSAPEAICIAALRAKGFEVIVNES